MEGQLNNGTDGKGMRYLTRIRMKQDGGKLIGGDSTLQVQNANSVIIYISSSTDFREVPYKQKSLALLNAANQQNIPGRKSSTHKSVIKIFFIVHRFLWIIKIRIRQHCLPMKG